MKPVARVVGMCLALIAAFALGISDLAGAVPLEEQKRQVTAQSGPVDLAVVESEHPYANDLNTFWIISNPDASAEASRIHFSRVELEQSVDYIIITDSEDNEFMRFTGTYAGGLWTDPIPSHDVKVYLVTDSNVRKWGFLIDQIESVSYPSLLYSSHPYPHNATLSWTLNNPDGGAKATKVHFSRVELEDGVDYIIIRDPTGNELQRITGIHASGLWTDPVPGNAVSIELVSDSCVSSWGFNVDQVASTAYTSLLYSPHPYPHNTAREWTLYNNDAGASATRIHFSRLELEDGIDYILIKDIYDTTYQTITQTQASGFWTLGVPGHDVKIQLISDGSVTAWGFNIDQVQSTTPDTPWPAPSPKPVLAESGHPYTNDVNQTWIVVNPNSAAVSSKIHFTRVDLRTGYPGDADYLYIRDNDGNLIQEIRLTHAHDTDFWTDYVPGHIVKVQLVTDGGYSDWGFQIDDIADGEPKPILAQSEHHYPDNANQTWIIMNPNVTAVSSKVHFAQSDLHVGYPGDSDYLYIRDNDGNLIQEIRLAHVNDTNFWTDYVPGHIVKVQLVTDGSARNWGFRVDDIVDGESRPVLAQSEHHYPDNANQTWVIQNPNVTTVSSKIHFTRSDLHIGYPGDSDYLYIRDNDGNLIQEIRLAHVSGTDFWTDYVPGHIVKVQLVTDSSARNWGFRVDNIADGEPKPILAQSEHRYAHNSDRIWIITNPNASATSSRIHFIRVDIRSSYPGDGDHLYIMDKDNNVIQDIRLSNSHSKDFWSEYVPGHIIKVRMTADDMNNDWGFRIDDIEPQVDTTPVPAFISGVYITVNEACTLYRDGIQIVRVQQAGEYKLPLPGYGEYTILLDYLEAQQEIRVKLSNQASEPALEVIYLPLVLKNN